MLRTLNQKTKANKDNHIFEISIVFFFKEIGETMLLKIPNYNPVFNFFSNK